MDLSSVDNETGAIYLHPWAILIQSPNPQLIVPPVLKDAAEDKVACNNNIKTTFAVYHNTANLNLIFNFWTPDSAVRVFIHKVLGWMNKANWKKTYSFSQIPTDHAVY